MTERQEYIRKLFQEALILLAADAETQIRLTVPGDVPFELVSDFELGCNLYLENFQTRLLEEQIQAIVILRNVLQELPNEALKALIVTRPILKQ